MIGLKEQIRASLLALIEANKGNTKYRFNLLTDNLGNKYLQIKGESAKIKIQINPQVIYPISLDNPKLKAFIYLVWEILADLSFELQNIPLPAKKDLIYEEWFEAFYLLTKPVPSGMG